MTIWDWVSHFFHGVLQSVLLWAPIVEPLMEPLIPYAFFFECEPFYSEWASLLDENRRPTENFMSLYWECMWRILTDRIADYTLFLIDKVMHYVIFAVGMLPDPFLTIPEWLLAIVGWIGETLPDWATDIADGLWRLWNLLPEPIRDGLQTWAEFLAAAPGAIQDWVNELVGRTIELVVLLWDWYVGLGQIITEWWRWAHDELNELLSDGYGWVVRVLGEAWPFLVWFYSNPTAALASWLSPWWESLVTFATDCLDFWYNLWGEYAEDLADFLSDPMEFLWNIGEDWLNERLERA